MSSTEQDWQCEHFGPYRLVKCLGVGGMATVYQVVHRESGERMALKRLLPQFTSDTALIRQFRREAEIARSLAHPNVACVHEFGVVDGVHYLTMEEVDGPSVLALLRRANDEGRPAPIGVSLWIVREILCALDYAMTGIGTDGQPLNIVHRDLSPSNIIINERAEVKIIDFGVAKSTVGRYATNSGRIKGKLGYMSPEALSGGQVDSRSDLYSLGVLAWELLTAQRLFRGNEREQMALRAAEYERTPPSVYNRLVSAEINELLAVALAAKPKDRWSSAAEMMREMEPLLRAEGPGASLRALRGWMRGETAPCHAVPQAPPTRESAERRTAHRACRATNSVPNLRRTAQERVHDAHVYHREMQANIETEEDHEVLGESQILEAQDAAALARGSSEFVRSDASIPVGLAPASLAALELESDKDIVELGESQIDYIACVVEPGPNN